MYPRLVMSLAQTGYKFWSSNLWAGPEIFLSFDTILARHLHSGRIFAGLVGGVFGSGRFVKGANSASNWQTCLEECNWQLLQQARPEQHNFETQLARAPQLVHGNGPGEEGFPFVQYKYESWTKLQKTNREVYEIPSTLTPAGSVRLLTWWPDTCWSTLFFGGDRRRMKFQDIPSVKLSQAG